MSLYRFDDGRKESAGKHGQGRNIVMFGVVSEARSQVRLKSHFCEVVGQLSDEKYIIRAKAPHLNVASFVLICNHSQAATALSRIGELESIGLNKLSDLLKDGAKQQCQTLAAPHGLADRTRVLP